MGRKTIKRGPGKRLIDGKDFHLADEIRYIQRRAAEQDGRFVTISSLALFSTDTGDAWLLDPEDHLAVRVARDGDRRMFTSRKMMRVLPSLGRVLIESTAMLSSTSTANPAGWSAFSATRPAASRNLAELLILQPPQSFEQHVANDLKTVGAQFVHCILGRVPITMSRSIIEID